MKPEEVLENLKVAVNVYHESGDHWNESDNEMDEALKIAIQALEKQVAKKLRIEPIGNVCPECFYDTAFMSKGEEYCPNCGQKIDWEETP